MVGAPMQAGGLQEPRAPPAAPHPCPLTPHPSPGMPLQHPRPITAAPAPPGASVLRRAGPRPPSSVGRQLCIHLLELLSRSPQTGFKHKFLLPSSRGPTCPRPGAHGWFLRRAEGALLAPSCLQTAVTPCGLTCSALCVSVSKSLLFTRTLVKRAQATPLTPP